MGSPSKGREGDGSHKAQTKREALMVSGLQLRAKRQEINKGTCEHYAYPIWVTVIGKKYRARCLGCGSVGPAVAEGAPGCARRTAALLVAVRSTAGDISGSLSFRGSTLAETC